MIVPAVFAVICIAGFMVSGLKFSFVLEEVLFRVSRNMVLVLSLIIPVITGLGLNFGIVLGAMAGQAGLFFIVSKKMADLSGIFVAMLVATPIAIILGYLVGLVLNKAKGKEMITSMILGFFANGIYQLIFIVFVGTIIPIKNKSILMPSGQGLKNTIDLVSVRKALDSAVFGKLLNTRLPIMTYLFTIAIAVIMYYLLKTKLGQDMRAVGQDMGVARVAGINVNKTRIIAVIFSTVLAAWGQVVFLQNMGNINTYSNHENVGLFSVASLLIGGATVNKATWQQALLGTILFHTLFIISPVAGQQLVGDAQIGEYFRVFVAYGVIGLALVLHAWESNKEKKKKEAVAEVEAK
ncbi:MAG: ABC transporter permease [Tissierellia bacterium]|nr:ABC transporter permease [Tissierellia bacterium]